MLKLNIIPQELKKEKKLKALSESLKVFFAVLIIIFSIYAIALLGTKFILQLHFIKVMNTTLATTGNTKSTDNSIRDINDQIKFIGEIQKNAIDWSYLIEYLSNNAGSGITYEKIDINKKNENIKISGFAKKRDDLIRFKKTMEKSNFFTSIELPIKDLLEKEKLTFTISAKISNYGFIEH